jgi:hypothetical protein
MLFSSLPEDLALQTGDACGSRDALLTRIALTYATENVPHRHGFEQGFAQVQEKNRSAGCTHEQ